MGKQRQKAKVEKLLSKRKTREGKGGTMDRDDGQGR